MAKKCPPGVICIENVTILFLLIIILFVLFFLQNRQNNSNKKHVKRENKQNNNSYFNSLFGLISKPFYSYSNIPNDVLLNPYEPPLRDDRIIPNRYFNERIPINIPTSSVDAPFRQVGILTRMNGPESILPLMGKPLFTNRDKWNFYTMSDKNNMIKLPITHKGKSCSNEYGCDNLYNGDVVYVEGYNDTFKVTVYDNNTIRYIPYI